MGTPFYFLNSSKTINFGENCSEEKLFLTKYKIQQYIAIPFSVVPSELIKILWQFFCSHAIFTDLTILRTIAEKLSDNLALETTKWDKSFEMKTNVTEVSYKNVSQRAEESQKPRHINPADIIITG